MGRASTTLAQYDCPMDQPSVTEAITSRRSIRAFLGTSVDDDVLATILRDAARAPSGTNIQPWNVYVVTGPARKAVVASTQAAFDVGNTDGLGDYYPTEFVEPYLGRRRKLGWDLYGLLGIAKGEWDKTAAQHRRNYQFFDAPVGLFFTLHETMQYGGWLDLGLYMSNVMTLARSYGLDTCPQAAWLEYSSVVCDLIGVPDNESLICGMALGYADEAAVVNQLTTERAELDEFVRFVQQ